MNRYTIAMILAFIAGFIVFIFGMLYGDLIICATGGLIAILVPLIFKLRQYQEKRKSILDYAENKDESLLPLKRTPLRRDDNKIKALMMIFIGLIALGFTSILMKNYIFEPTYFTLQKAVNDGCTELNMKENCNKDPSEIMVPLDVNKDGTVGGPSDTLSNLFEKYYNCTGSCVKKRCGCPGY
jgi:uncharacterized membrane protein YiaA